MLPSNQKLSPLRVALTGLLLGAMAQPGLALPAQASEGLQPVLAPGRTRPLLDAPGDGSAWALGETYKLGLSAEGTRFTPFLGSRVERPLWLELGAPQLAVGGQLVPNYAAAAQVDGQRMEIDRGWFSERFDCGRLAVEHSFLLPSKAALPGRGDLSLSLPVSGDLVPVGGGAGQRFEARGMAGEWLSTITYGDWLARDAAGRELKGEIRLEGGALTITLPESYWATAQFPLLIDPLLSVFSIDANSFANETDSDVSYDQTNDVWVVVYTDSGNDNDDDVLSRRYTGAGVLMEEQVVDIDGEDESHPRIANNNKNNAFLIVWARQGDLVNTDRIQGRRRLAGNTTQGPVFNISNTVGEISPDVGGTSDLINDKWAVVWTDEQFGASASNLRMASVDQSSLVGNQVLLEQYGGLLPGAGPVTLETSISSTAGAFGQWVVLSEIQQDFGSFELQALAVSASNFAQTPLLTVAPQLTVKPEARVAGNGKDFLMVRTDAAQGKNLIGHRLELAGSLIDNGTINLTTALESASANLPQEQASLSGDGCRYVLSYRQGAPGVGNFDVRCAAFVIIKNGPSATLQVTDPALSAQVTAEEDRLPALATKADGGDSSLQAFGCWTRVATSTNLNLNGFRFDTAQQDSISEVPTGCGGLFSVPSLNISGVPQLGSTLTLSLSPGLGGPGAPLILIGEPINLPLCPGQSTCALGVGTTYLSFSTNSATIPIPCKLGFLGAQFAMQGLFLGTTSSSSCGAPFYPIQFRTSDTLIVTIG